MSNKSAKTLPATALLEDAPSLAMGVYIHEEDYYRVERATRSLRALVDLTDAACDSHTVNIKDLSCVLSILEENLADSMSDITWTSFIPQQPVSTKH